MRAAISCSFLLAILCVNVSHAQLEPPLSAADTPSSACGAAQFAEEVVMAAAHTQLCPKPIDSTLELLHAKLESTPTKSTSAFFDVLRELRDHCQAQVQGTQANTADWRVALAEHIDEVLARAKARQHPSAAFAAVRPAWDRDPPTCVFMTGDPGQAESACYFVKGSARPQPLAAGTNLFELANFEDAYLAHRALAIAYSALVKLDLPQLDAAIQRLELAEQRWESLRKRGYLQYPWELALSSALASYRDYQACFAHDVYCTGEQGLDPEQTRLIALHPGVGMGFSGYGRHPKPSATATLSLSVELIGLTRYANNFQTYFGASVGAVVNDGDFHDVRPGVFVHLTRWLHVGYLMSLFQRSTRYDATVFLSSDLASAFGANFFE